LAAVRGLQRRYQDALGPTAGFKLADDWQSTCKYSPQ
jgi:hypothetical protein